MAHIEAGGEGQDSSSLSLLPRPLMRGGYEHLSDHLFLSIYIACATQQPPRAHRSLSLSLSLLGGIQAHRVDDRAAKLLHVGITAVGNANAARAACFKEFDDLHARQLRSHEEVALCQHH